MAYNKIYRNRYNRQSIKLKRSKLKRSKLKRSKLNRNKKLKTRKNKKNKKFKGGTNEECAMCCQQTNDKTLIPNACLMKYGKYRAHKICSDCWWNKFAQEGVNHKCPGCEKKLPLNKDPYHETKNQVIDLTEDD